MNKFEAKSVALGNGWEQCLGLSLTNSKYCESVPTGRLEMYLNIGYELSFDNETDDHATLELQHWKPSTAHPPVASRKCYFRHMTEDRFREWLAKTADELLEIGREQSKNGKLP
jgi:hypothetical protein